MKYIMTVIILGMGCVIFAQEQEALTDSAAPLSETSEAAPHAIQKSKWYSLHLFQLADGTGLRRKDTLTLLKTVPENTVLLRQEKGFRISAAVCLALTAGFFGVHLGYTRNNSDALYIGNMSPVIYGGLFVSGVIGMITAGLANDRLNKAVSNYNLSIMGLPVPLGKK